MRFVSVSDSSSDRLIQPPGCLRQPEANQPGAGDRLERHDDDPEIPVHPAGQKARELAEPRPVAPSQTGVFIEGAHGRLRDGHFAQHAHDQHHQESGDHEGEDRRGPSRFDDHTAADKKSGADDAAESDHRHVPLF